MRRSRALRVTVLALAIATLCPAAWTLPDEKDKWFRVETANFTLLGNAGPRRMVKVGKRLEQLREVLTETSKGMTHISPLPTTIFVFKDRRSFAPYNLREDGTPDDELAGYFVRASDGNYVAIDVSTEDRPYPVIYHEYLHYFLENNIPGIPLWLNEGIAEFYSTFAIHGGRADGGPTGGTAQVDGGAPAARDSPERRGGTLIRCGACEPISVSA